MLNALQTLIDEGCIKGDEINELIGKCVDRVSLDDNRALVLLAYLRGQGENVEPGDLEDNGDGMIEYGRAEYRVLDDTEADEACGDWIENSLWCFNASFLAYNTDLPEEVFKALSEKCEDGNDVIMKVVRSTCGIDKIVNEAVSADGRGHFLATYDGEEGEYSVRNQYFYIYRVN